MNNKTTSNSDDFDAALVGKQQLLIKSMLSEQSLVAKQQLAIKSGLAQKRNSISVD